MIIFYCIACSNIYLIFLAAEIRDVSELKWNFSTTSGEQFSLLEFGNHTHIFSINVALAGTGACAIAFIDEDEDITLVSEPAR